LLLPARPATIGSVRGWLILLIAITGRPAGAEQTLRLATVAPEGTHWAKELKAFSDEVERRTHGELRIKIFWGGVTGDDLGSVAWVQRGQLEGVASGGMLCEQLAPSMRVLRILGVFRSPEEVRAVREKLEPTFDGEFRRSGYVSLGYSTLGGALLFSRIALRTMADIRKARIWVWDLDLLGREYAEMVGINAVRLPIVGVKPALDKGELDALISIPSAALAFQWHTKMRYFIGEPLAFVTGCLVVDAKVFERYPPDVQKVLRELSLQMSSRVEEMVRGDDVALLERLRKLGYEQLEPSDQVRSEFFDANLKAREKLGESLVPAALVRRAIALLQAYRAQHHPK
jgi:TRAP-type C4-dicarboxylate transport system substrate-binding protein